MNILYVVQKAIEILLSTNELGNCSIDWVTKHIKGTPKAWMMSTLSNKDNCFSVDKYQGFEVVGYDEG